MPWNQGGGGPWGGGSGGSGGGGQNPWGQRGGGQQPNIEELIRKGQERVRRIMPGGFGPNFVLLAIVVAAVMLWLASGVFIVRPSEVGLVLRFGALNREAQPGMRWHLPTPIESAYIVNVSTNRIEVPQRSSADLRNVRAPASVAMLTKDENILEVQYVIQWVVSDAALYRFNVQHDNETLIRQVADSAMREVVSQTDAQRALTQGRRELPEETQRLMQRVLDGYGAGVRITDIQLSSIEPPQQVIAAFRDVQAARTDRERATFDAEAYRNDIVPRARGNARSIILNAEAEQQRVVARAQGDASRFQQVLDAYRLAPDITTQRLYIEAIEELLRNTTKVIVDQGAGGPGVIPYLPLPGLRPGQPAAPPNVGSTGSGGAGGAAAGSAGNPGARQ
jgi:membrane protease subunit HflK